MFFLEHYMTFRSINFYIASFMTCFIAALIIKFSRQSYSSDNEFIIILMGALPSFLYLVGLIALIPIVKKDLTFAAYIKTSFFLTFGALTYEFEQAFTSRTFDYYDVIATILALLVMLGVHCFKNHKNNKQQ